MKRSAALASLLESYKQKKKIRLATNVKVAERSKKQSNLVSKPKQKQLISLPEKYESLIDFFESMETSIRLFRMRQRITNFTDIKSSVECLNKRRFSYANLAQLKYILPEKIVLKKVIIQKDERTEFKEYDLNINLQNLEPGKGFSSLKEEFRSGLMDFLKSHPEGEDVPEGLLPEPFNGTKQVSMNEATDLPRQNPVLASRISAPPQHTLVAVSHIPSSFQRRFSSKDSICGAEKMNLRGTVPLGPVTSDFSIPKSVCIHQHDDSATNMFLTRPLANNSLLFSTPVKNGSRLAVCADVIEGMKPKENEDCFSKHVDVAEDVPVKVTPARLMPVTPDLSMRKRVPIHQKDDSDSVDSPSKLLRRPPTNRSLFFSTPMKPEENKNSFSKHVAVVEGTPAKVISTPSRLMPGTPDLSMRKTDTTHQYDDSVDSARLRRPPTNRSLFFGTLMKPEENDNSLSKHIDAIEGTTAKVISTPSRLMPGAPDLSKYKASTLHKDDGSIDKLHRCPRRSLLFSSTVMNTKAKEKSNEGRSSFYLNNLLGAELVQSIRENETISRAKFRKRMIACLPKVFDMIHFMFQSIKHSVTTTEEVIRKITANPFYITDRKEIEAQLTLLKELLPNWISEVVVSSGDTLLRINKMRSTDELRRRLAQAV
ncbi:hypothetical protein C5167_029157 [Papaver somniferum]|uniref:CDT1-like protein b n=1 Tax=Papaver somniferum TaxID=3469 RepID=UPI000E6FC716|nr:CDT1-like protein b [Papaver somniferum]RZC93180.1 hypothetical protein C5167_029157 [Papaver somniferum]